MPLEFDSATDQGKKGVIAPDPDIVAWVKLRSPLTDDDTSRCDHLATECFHAKALRIRITAVLCATCTFFMCHTLLLNLKNVN